MKLYGMGINNLMWVIDLIFSFNRVSSHLSIDLHAIHFGSPYALFNFYFCRRGELISNFGLILHVTFCFYNRKVYPDVGVKWLFGIILRKCWGGGGGLPNIIDFTLKEDYLP